MAEVGPATLVGTRIETRSYGYDVTLPSGRIVRLHETGIDFPPGMTPDEHMAILFEAQTIRQLQPRLNQKLR